MTARRTTFLPLAFFVVGACAAKEDAEPATIGLDVQFPSTAAAVAVEGVKVYVYDGKLQCNDLVRLRQTSQALPPNRFESRSLSPCELHAGVPNSSVELDLDKEYTMLAVGQAAGRDLLVGCALQSAFGATKAQPIALTYIDATQSIPETTCTKLSDKCGGRCQ
jgi:hypothetical protein